MAPNNPQGPIKRMRFTILFAFIGLMVWMVGKMLEDGAEIEGPSAPSQEWPACEDNNDC